MGIWTTGGIGYMHELPQNDPDDPRPVVSSAEPSTDSPVSDSDDEFDFDNDFVVVLLDYGNYERRNRIAILYPIDDEHIEHTHVSFDPDDICGCSG